MADYMITMTTGNNGKLGYFSFLEELKSVLEGKM